MSYYQQGAHIGKITNQQLGESSGGTAFVAITFSLIGRVDPADPDGGLIECEPGEQTMWWYLTEKTMEFTAEKLARIGYEKSSIRHIDLGSNGAVDLRGREIEVYNKPETYNGKLRDKWDLSNGGMSVKPLEPAKARQLDALFAKHAKKATKAAPSAKAPPTETVVVNAAGEEEDIPF